MHTYIHIYIYIIYVYKIAINLIILNGFDLIMSWRKSDTSYQTDVFPSWEKIFNMHVHSINIIYCDEKICFKGIVCDTDF